MNIKKTFTISFTLLMLANISLAALSQEELKIWNQPQFKAQFAQSYIAETEIEPSINDSQRKTMMEVMELISGDKMDQALRQLQRVNNNTATAVFDFTIANIYFQQEKFEQAIESYITATKKYPKFRRAWKNLALIYVRNGDYEQAIPALTKVIELGGGDSLTFGLLGFAYGSLENHIPAESAYRLAILLDPVTLDWKMGLARSFFKQQNFAAAMSLCQQLTEQYPDRFDLWLLQANAYLGMERPTKAAEIYELVDAMGKSSPESLNMLGDIYTNEKLYDLAVSAYSRAMKIDASDPHRPIRAAEVLVAYGALEQTRKLIADIESAYEEQLNDKNRKDILQLQARLAVADGDADEEVKVLEHIVKIDPLDGQALILLGQNSARQNQNEKAIMYYERAAGIEQFEADAKIRHAQLLVAEGKYSQALPLLRRAQQLKPRENVQKYLEQVERLAKN